MGTRSDYDHMCVNAAGLLVPVGPDRLTNVTAAHLASDLPLVGIKLRNRFHKCFTAVPESQ